MGRERRSAADHGLVRRLEECRAVRERVRAAGEAVCGEGGPRGQAALAAQLRLGAEIGARPARRRQAAASCTALALAAVAAEAAIESAERRRRATVEELGRLWKAMGRNPSRSLADILVKLEAAAGVFEEDDEDGEGGAWDAERLLQAVAGDFHRVALKC